MVCGRHGGLAGRGGATRLRGGGRGRALGDRRELGQHRPEAQLGGLADDRLALARSFDAGQVDDDVVALAGDLGLGDPEAVDALRMMSTRDVEGVGVELPDRRQDDRDAALEVEAEDRRGPATRASPMNVPTTSTTRDRRDTRCSASRSGPASSSGLVVVHVGLGRRRRDLGVASGLVRRSASASGYAALRDRGPGERQHDARRHLELHRVPSSRARIVP